MVDKYIWLIGQINFEIETNKYILQAGTYNVLSQLESWGVIWKCQARRQEAGDGNLWSAHTMAHCLIVETQNTFCNLTNTF